MGVVGISPASLTEKFSFIPWPIGNFSTNPYCCFDHTVDGGWGEFVECSKCSGECGKGTCTRKRKCDSPSPSNGGKDCEGKDSKEEVCDTGVVCPGRNQKAEKLLVCSSLYIFL